MRMRAFCGASLLLLLGCGSELDGFIGTWAGNVESGGTCGLGGSVAGALVIKDGASGDLESTSDAGCVFRFAAAAQTAVLENAPVQCSTILGVEKFSTYKLTKDGDALSFEATATLTPATGGADCSITISGTDLVKQ